MIGPVHMSGQLIVSVKIVFNNHIISGRRMYHCDGYYYCGTISKLESQISGVGVKTDDKLVLSTV